MFIPGRPIVRRAETKRNDLLSFVVSFCAFRGVFATLRELIQLNNGVSR
jgi:hypothetical protein